LHLLDLDESGNTGTNLNDTEQQVLLLAALIVPAAAWQPLERDLAGTGNHAAHIPAMADGHVARGTGSSAPLDAVGMTVTRTPLRPRPTTSAALPVPSSAWNRRAGSSRVASSSWSDVSRSGSEHPHREHTAIHPPPGQLEQLARTQRRAAGGVQVTMNRSEEQAHGILGESQ
jgi:hypothetical protein